MPVLIVESNAQLGLLWKRHLGRLGKTVVLVETDTEALNVLRTQHVSIIVLDVMLRGGSAFAVADYASYRFPKLRILFVSSTSFFSDGSIFGMASNACAFLPAATPPDDLAAMVEHYATKD